MVYTKAKKAYHKKNYAKKKGKKDGTQLARIQSWGKTLKQLIPPRLRLWLTASVSGAWFPAQVTAGNHGFGAAFTLMNRARLPYSAHASNAVFNDLYNILGPNATTVIMPQGFSNFCSADLYKYYRTLHCKHTVQFTSSVAGDAMTICQYPQSAEAASTLGSMNLCKASVDAKSVSLTNSKPITLTYNKRAGYYNGASKLDVYNDTSYSIAFNGNLANNLVDQVTYVCQTADQGAITGAIGVEVESKFYVELSDISYDQLYQT